MSDQHCTACSSPDVTLTGTTAQCRRCGWRMTVGAGGRLRDLLPVWTAGRRRRSAPMRPKNRSAYARDAHTRRRNASKDSG